MMHNTLAAARKVTDDICSDTAEQRAKIAAYAYERQVCIFHASWAVFLHEGHELGACDCAACERAGLSKRIAAVAQAARSAFTRRLMAEYGHVEQIKAAHPDWWIEANAVTRKAANAEALRVLAELERVSA